MGKLVHVRGSLSLGRGGENVNPQEGFVRLGVRACGGWFRLLLGIYQRLDGLNKSQVSTRHLFRQGSNSHRSGRRGLAVQFHWGIAKRVS